jgi:predicted TIM-barrel fold metal-dependent hydrolase
VVLPEELAALVRERVAHWNEKGPLAALYTEDAVFLDRWDPNWLRGRDEVADYVSTQFARPYTVTPVAFGVTGNGAYIAAYFTRGEGEAAKHFGHVQWSLVKGGDGVWRIAAETPAFPGPPMRDVITAEQRIGELDAAGIRKAAVLSTAYWFGSPLRPPVEHEYEKVRAENDWVVGQVAQYPGRLYALCSFNPLKDYAIAELERCAAMPQVRGIKLHFGNSGVDVRNPEHVETLRRVFRAANEHKLAIVAHLWTSDTRYGAEDAKIFLERLLPEAPDVTVQIAHFAGGGPGYTDEALGVYADAIARHDRRTKNLYFDVATVADQQSEAVLQTFAKRIRQVGTKRVLFGTDLGPPLPRQSWMIFRTTVPLTDDELRVIAGNVAPYLR